MRTFVFAVLLAVSTTASPQLEELLRQRPDDPVLWFFQARAQADAGNRAATLAALDKVSALGDGFLPPREGGFAKLWDDPGFRAARERLEAKLPRLDFAPTEIELDDRTLIPEGIAYDKRSESFFIGSIAQGRIVRVRELGSVALHFASKQQGLDSILGLAVDAPRRLLYAAATSALTDDGRKRRRNAVLAWDVDTAALKRRVDLPDAQQLNDVTVALGGRVFASDSASGAVYEIPREGATARTVVAPGQIPGSNGLAPSPDGRRLYVAHSTGIAVVDLATGNVKRVANTTRETVAAIDGLYESQGELIGVQNMTSPGRVIAITLSRDGESIIRVRTLLSHHHNVLDEPTTGVVTDHGFFLLAATGVRHYGAKGVIEDADTVPKPAVVRVLLPR